MYTVYTVHNIVKLGSRFAQSLSTMIPHASFPNGAPFGTLNPWTSFATLLKRNNLTLNPKEFALQLLFALFCGMQLRVGVVLWDAAAGGCCSRESQTKWWDFLWLVMGMWGKQKLGWREICPAAGPTLDVAGAAQRRGRSVCLVWAASIVHCPEISRAPT